MKNKIILTIVFLAMIFAFGSCEMHNVHGTPYKVWHVTGRTHRHWGAPNRATSRYRFWGNRRNGPRTFKYRGHFRDYQ